MVSTAVGRALLVATAGGHLTQLDALANRLGVDVANALWVTVPTPQSTSLLAARDVVWAEYGSPRDMKALARHFRLARRMLRGESFAFAVSTGASLAPPFLAAARLSGIPSHYIESATRVDGPSFSGRLVARIPGVMTYSQYESWAGGRWQYRGSILDGWRTEAKSEQRPIRRALVTVGSARGFRFNRMLVAARNALPPSCDITWQVLDSYAQGLTGRVVSELSSDDLREELDSVDVVISHAGTGSALSALAAGLCPVLVPRRSAYGEHIDDHQLQIAAELSARELAVVRLPEDLATADLEAAAARRAVEVPAKPFLLAP